MSEELIQQLDPKRDYGVRTYEDVVREVREGKLILKEGPTHQPLINDTRGLAVKGTGTWKIQQPSEPRIHTKAVFLERAHSDFEAVYGAMIESAVKGDVRAQKLFMELYVGRPKEVAEVVEKEVVNRLFELALQPKEKVLDV
jgi:hypothetical protein|tara:strand:- start:91 stop:516 length:426 start_codon:yes stop_codon:yes gene_type:complete